MGDGSVSGECKESECVNDPNFIQSSVCHDNQRLNTSPLNVNIENSNGINILYTNTDVLHNKLDELETIALKENADVIAITETLLKNMPPHVQPEDFKFKIKGFTTIHNYNGRGLCLFIKENLNFTQLFEYDALKTSIFI